MRLSVVFLMALLPFFANAQHQGDVWVFANGNKLDFSTSPPSVSSGTLILPTDNEVEGVASIADADGNLLFCSDGVSLWDGENNLITDELSGHQSSTNSAYIVPVPSSTQRYYLFTLDAMQNNLTNGLRYSIVDVCGSEGGISLSSMNQLLSLNMTEKMTAIRHSNGIDFWLVTHEFGNDVFKVFLITAQGISLNASYACGSSHGPQQSAVVGQMKASPSGEFIALNITNYQMTDLFAFDKENGAVNCLISFPPDTFNGNIFSGAYGVSFSANSRFLYLSGNGFFRLWQFDIEKLGQSNSAFYGSKVILSDDYPASTSTTFHQLQLGSDGKIYCASWNNEHLAVIHEPDLPGLSCSFEDSAIVLPNLGNYGLPAFIDSYDYTISGVCDTGVGMGEVDLKKISLQVFPNPFSTQTQLTYRTTQGMRPTLQLTDMLGRVVQTVQLPGHEGSYTIDATELGTGVYFCSLVNGVQVLATQKLVVSSKE